MTTLEELEAMIKDRRTVASQLGWSWLSQIVDEDTDVLRRHSRIRHTTWTSGQPEPAPLCAYEFAGGDGWVLDWTSCPDVQSVFRRYGTAPTF